MRWLGQGKTNIPTISIILNKIFNGFLEALRWLLLFKYQWTYTASTNYTLVKRWNFERHIVTSILRDRN